MIDVATVITGHNANYASQAVRIIYDKYPEVHDKIVDFLLPGQGCGLPKWGQIGPSTNSKAVASVIRAPPRVRRTSAS